MYKYCIFTNTGRFFLEGLGTLLPETSTGSCNTRERVVSKVSLRFPGLSARATVSISHVLCFMCKPAVHGKNPAPVDRWFISFILQG